VHIELRFAFDSASALNAVNHALHVDAAGDHDAIANHHGKS
jgi:hypothetical protein